MQNVLPSIRKYFAPPIVQLALIGFASLLVYVFAFLLPINLLDLYDQPRRDVFLLPNRGVTAHVGLVFAFITVWGLYLLGYRICLKLGTEPDQSNQKRAAWVVVLIGTLMFIIAFLFVAPFDAADIYDNIMHGRILGIHHANPFQQVIEDFPDDPFYEYAAWKKAPSAYGPFWESLAGLTAWLTGDGIIANVMAFKILPGLFQLFGIVLVILTLKRNAPEKMLSGALLLGWNPLVLYETWGNGHNDVVMAFWFLLAAWWIMDRRYTLAILSLLVGSLMKFLPILLVPAVLWIAWQNLETIRARLMYLIRTGAIALITVIAAYYPFWNGFASLSIDRRMNMFATSIPAAVYHNLKITLGADESAQLVSLAAFGLLAIFVLFQTFRIKPSSHGFIQITFNILVFYLLLTCLWFQQWYCIWLVCLAPLLPPKSRNLALVFSFWVINKQLIFGPIFVPTLYWHPDTYPRLEHLYVLTVLGVPWLYTLWILFRGKKRYAEL